MAGVSGALADLTLSGSSTALAENAVLDLTGNARDHGKDRRQRKRDRQGYFRIRYCGCGWCEGKHQQHLYHYSGTSEHYREPGTESSDPWQL